MSRPTFLELFAGAGGMTMGIEAGGFDCIGHAEIEPHARAILRHHWPEVPLYGDVKQLTGEQASHCDLVSFGAPCQDLSVAGKRAGLAGLRSILFYEGVRLWNETGATYALYENVMGALSSNEGKDFAAVLSALVGSAVTVPADGWRGGGGVVAGRDAVAAFRVLDLQHFGPPQRRVRVFVLAARAGGVDPAEVLAVHPCSPRHFEESPRERQRIAASVGGGVEGGVIPYTATRFAKYEVGVGRLRASGGDLGGGSETILAFHHTQTPISGDVSPAIGWGTNGMGVMAFDTYNQSVSDVVHTLRDPNGTFGDALPAICTTGPVTHALTAEGCDASEDGTGRGTPIVVGYDDPNQRTVGALVASYSKGLGHNKDDLFVVGPAPVSAEESASEAVRLVRRDDGAEAVQREDGSPEPVRAPEVLRQEVRSEGVGRKGEHSEAGEFGALAFEEGCTEGAMPAVRSGERKGRSPQGPQPVEQCAGEPGAHLPELPHEGAQGQSGVFGDNVRQAPSSERLLRTAQPTREAMGRPAYHPRQPAPVGRPRRLLPIETERLMSWPDDHTRYGTREDGTVYELSDTARYRMAGNGVGSVCVQWIAERLAAAIGQQAVAEAA